MVLMNLLVGRNGDADIENGLVDTVGEGRSGTNGESSIEVHTRRVLVTQTRLTLCDPTDCSLPGSSVHDHV